MIMNLQMRRQQIRTALLQLGFKLMPNAGTTKLQGGALVKSEVYVNEPLSTAFNFNTIVDLNSVQESWSWIYQPEKDEPFMAVLTSSNFAAALDLLENLAKLHPILLQASSAGKEAV